MLVGAAVFTAGLALVMARTTGMDRVTALLACVPNGPVEMGILAERYGGDTGVVVFAQTLRIVTVVVLVPFAIHGEARVGTGFAPAPFLPLALGAVFLTALAVAVAVIFRRIGLSNPFFLGPLTLSAVASRFDWHLAHYPPYILAAAQVLLGTWLGSTLRRELLARSGRLMTASIISTVVFVATCTSIGALVAPVLGLRWETLGLAPGGVTEMALTARVLSLDVAMITAFHLVCIYLIMPNLPWVIAWLHGRSGASEGGP